LIESSAPLVAADPYQERRRPGKQN
jgi:hypothetical protein